MCHVMRYRNLGRAHAKNARWHLGREIMLGDTQQGDRHHRLGMDSANWADQAYVDMRNEITLAALMLRHQRTRDAA